MSIGLQLIPFGDILYQVGRAYSWIYRKFWQTMIDSFGRHFIINKGFFVANPHLLKIGDNVFFNAHVKIFNNHEWVTFGDFVSVGPNTSFITFNYDTDHWDRPMMYKPTRSYEPITVESDVWIGANCTILPGITIGRGAIVAAGSVVSHDVEPYSVVGGVPAKRIKYRFDKATIAKAKRVNMKDFV